MCSVCRMGTDNKHLLSDGRHIDSREVRVQRVQGWTGGIHTGQCSRHCACVRACVRACVCLRQVTCINNENESTVLENAQLILCKMVGRLLNVLDRQSLKKRHRNNPWRLWCII